MTKIVYEIMHENRRVAKIDETGFLKSITKVLCLIIFILKKRKILIP